MRGEGSSYSRVSYPRLATPNYVDVYDKKGMARDGKVKVRPACGDEEGHGVSVYFWGLGMSYSFLVIFMPCSALPSKRSERLGRKYGVTLTVQEKAFAACGIPVPDIQWHVAQVQ